MKVSSEKSWPPGFRFHPTDEELILYYLKRKICRRKILLDNIGETDVYKWDPEELPGLSLMKSGDRQWFFFSPRDRKYPNGARSNRATRHGYWKATGKDRNVTCNSRNVGVKKTLVFYKGRAPNGERTDWVMHEYTLDEEEFKRCQNVKDYYALYKVFKKSGPGPKNGEQYGAPFKEEEWADDECPDFNNSDDQEMPVKQLNEVTSVADVREHDPSVLEFDDIEEFMKQIADEPVPDFHEVNDNCYSLPQVVGLEETESAILDPFSGDYIFLGGLEPIRVSERSGQQSGVQASFDFTQSALSQVPSYEAPEVTSSHNVCEEDPLILHEEDFLEIDDLTGPEPTFSHTEKPLEKLQAEEMDGFSEFDLFHDASMFLHDLGGTHHGTVSNLYLNVHENNVADQLNYQLQSNVNMPTHLNNQLWMHGQAGNVLTFSEPNQDFVSPSPSGAPYESSCFITETNQNQENEGGDAGSRFSSALWSFVESIPTTPASASENAHRAFERMSSFSRLRLNNMNTYVSVVNATTTETKRRTGRIRGFFFFSVLGAFCAILWFLIGAVGLYGRTIST